MIIGIDLDEVLGEFFPAYLMFYNKKYAANLCKEDFIRWDFLGICQISKEESIVRLSEFAKSGGLEKILPRPGAQAMVARLEKNHELHVITSRPLDVSCQTIQWVGKHFPWLFRDIHFCSKNGGAIHFRSKSSVCQAIGATLLLDDHPDHADTCVADNIPVYLFDQPWNWHVKPHDDITRIFSWQDKAIEILCS